MGFFLNTFIFSLLVVQVFSLQCYSCDGGDCHETEICGEHQDRCRTTIMTILAAPKTSEYFLKGCDMSGKPNNSISHILNNQVVFLTEEHCKTDLCNNRTSYVMDILGARGFRQNSLQCYSCSSADQTCFKSPQVVMNCAKPEDTCVDITSVTALEDFPADEQRIKGCGQLSHCQDALGFHNQKSFHLIKCCNSSRCNNDMQDYMTDPLPLNGVTCYSCEGNATHSCSAKNITEVQCQGPMTQCYEASGLHGTSKEYSIVKGCASPSWCNSNYTSVYKNLGALYSHCCTGDLCNNRISNGILKPSARSLAGHQVTSHNVLLSTGLLLSIAFLLS